MSAENTPEVPLGEKLKAVGVRAAQGGIAGAAAMSIQVLTLMWMRTTINYQYRYGTTTTEAFKTLYRDGGVPRFYRGLVPALLQGPLSRFGDTAANAGMLALMDSFELTRNLPIAMKTATASVSAGLFRILLMPIDTVKTTMQVEGKDGLAKLMSKARNNGPTTFFQGALASAAATTVGHYPWFFVYNYLNAKLPKYEDDLVKKLSRNAFIGFCASACSDTISNSIRVVKVYKQSNTEKLSYTEVVKRVVKEDGLAGLFGRGLKTKIISNGVQGLMFSVMWRTIDDKFFKKDDKKKI